jgi:hypothetical protein
MRKAESEPPEESLRRLKGLWHARGIPASAVQPLQKLGKQGNAQYSMRSVQDCHQQLDYQVGYPATHLELGRGSMGPSYLQPTEAGNAVITAGEGAFAVVELCSITGLVVDQAGKVSGWV